MYGKLVLRRLMLCAIVLFFALFASGMSSLKAEVIVQPQRPNVPIKKNKKAGAYKPVVATQLDSLIQAFRSGKYVLADTLANPYYSYLFSRPQLHEASLSRAFQPDYGFGKEPRKAEENLSQPVYDLVGAADENLLYACVQYPALVLLPTEREDFAEAPVTDKDKGKLTLSDHLTVKEPQEENPFLSSDDEVAIVVRHPNFWTFKTNFSLQFTQNYVSDNWYKGGESHNALLAATVIEANFNNQRKITFDNKLEMKLGFQTSQNDEEHKYKTNSDLLRLTNKLGLRAAKHWYYTVMLQSWTQFYRGYKSNDPKIYSDFMSPFESLLSIGMDYQYATKNNRFTVNATLSPLAGKLKYVNRPSLVTSFGINEGHHSDWEFGANITINYTWKIINNISWTGRIYYFTDYSKTQVEWENTFNLTINKYLSTKLFLYPRFDDSRNRDEGVSNFEFNELLSLGLNVNF